jgi:deoxyribose-phosphate aldolase
MEDRMDTNSRTDAGPVQTLAALAGCMDATLLKPQATRDEIIRLCEAAARLRTAAVCVMPIFVAETRARLADSGVAVCTVLGFPLGAVPTETKVGEACRAINDGATELDMVLWVGGMKAGEHTAVREDVEAVTNVAHVRGATVKVILETCLLTDDEKRVACRLCAEAHADFVKTSTGFSTGGATVADVRLMHAEVAPHGLRVKASGGIRTLADAGAMLAAGASRLGVSAAAAILDEARVAGWPAA